MKQIEERAESNKLLSKPINLAVYIVMYRALTDSKALTIKEIIERILKQFSVDITTNKISYILKVFVDKDIVRKNVKNGIYKYYLHKKIYTPSQNTPIPIYQLVLLVLAFLIMFTTFISTIDIIFKWVSLTFFGTVLLVVMLHQIMFEYRY